MLKSTSIHKTILALTATILAAGGAQAYELKLGTNMPPIDIHGFASQGFLDSTGYNYLANNTKGGSFKFSEAAINASMNPFPRTHIAAQGFLFDVGNVGEYAPALDYAAIDYTFNDEIGIRAGRIRRPEGIYNAIQDIDLARTSVLLPQGMYDSRWRDFSGSIDGGSVFGNIDLHKGGGLSYEVYGGLISLADNGGIARLLQDSLRNPPTQYGGVNAFPEFGLQFWYNTPINGLRAGYAFTDALDFSYNYNLNIPPMFGGGAYRSSINAIGHHFSLEYLYKSWTFQAEYKYSTYYNHTQVNGVRGPMSWYGTDAGFVSAAYRFNKWFEAGAYYGEDYPNVSDRSGSTLAAHSDGYQKDAALSLRFDPTSWWVFKVEGHYIQGTALLYDNASNPTRSGNGYFMLAVKSTFSF